MCNGCTTDARYWVPDRAAAARQAEKQQGETDEEAAQRSDLQMQISYEAVETILEFSEFRATVEKMHGYVLGKILGVGFWRARRAVHRRIQYEKAGCPERLTRANGQRSYCVMAIRF